MCGIAGWIGAVDRRETIAGNLAHALRHRGPDKTKFRYWPEATLVHTRLSIIDLSPAGAQPMGNEDGTIWTVFNGEIYNHQELRRNLQARGHIFKGRSDTEVIPHLYEEEGIEFVSRLRGMFALAIYDARTQTLALARDRFGIKPLFYAPSQNWLAFASEIKPLLEFPGIDRRPDRQALYDFTALSYIPAPQTVYAGIRALEPGQILEAQLNCDRVSSKLRAYHKWSIAPDPTITLPQAVDRAEELLGNAVHRQMESDMPLGALLSGGIDSSLVSSAAQLAAGGGLRTFNVRFSDKEYDETWAAVEVAKHIKSCHETLEMDELGGCWQNISQLLVHVGQPFGDTSLFPVNAVCQLMRRHVSVALSGDGGDEAFGYNIYWRVARVARWQKLPAPIWRAAPLALMPLTMLGILPGRLLDRIDDLTAADDTSIIQNLWSLLPEKEQRHLCRDSALLPVRRWFEPKWEYQLPRRASRLDRLYLQATEAIVRMTLPNDFLFKVDMGSMKESLEVRVPLLDEELFDFGMTLPYHLKTQGRTCKTVLRAVAARKLPSSIARKEKYGFGIPVGSWVDTDFKASLRDTVLGPSSKLPEFFRPETYRPIIESFCDGRSCSGISGDVLYKLAIMLLSVQLTLDYKPGPAKGL